VCCLIFPFDRFRVRKLRGTRHNCGKRIGRLFLTMMDDEFSGLWEDRFPIAAFFLSIIRVSPYVQRHFSRGSVALCELQTPLAKDPNACARLSPGLLESVALLWRV